MKKLVTENWQQRQEEKEEEEEEKKKKNNNNNNDDNNVGHSFQTWTHIWAFCISERNYCQLTIDRETFGYLNVTNESRQTKSNAFLRLHITVNDRERERETGDELNSVGHVGDIFHSC